MQLLSYPYLNNQPVTKNKQVINTQTLVENLEFENNNFKKNTPFKIYTLIFKKNFVDIHVFALKLAMFKNLIPIAILPFFIINFNNTLDPQNNNTFM